MTSMKIRLIAATPLIALVAACSGEGADTDAEQVPAPAGEPPAEIDARQDNFEAIGDAFKVIRVQLDESAPDMEAIKAAAADINTRAEAVAGQFPDGSGINSGYDTEALASIWQKPEEFATAMQNFQTAAAGMLAAAESGDAAAVGAQVGELGGTCKGCHDNFRVDDE